MQVNENIHINQIGYRPEDKKVAAIHGKGGAFQVINNKNGEVVYSDETTSNAVEDKSSGDSIYYGDFSAVKEVGSYHIQLEGYGKSYSFQVADNVYHEVKDAALKVMYFQRCGMALDEKYAGVWNHDECHMAEGIIYDSPEKKLDSSGGWHDAGDHGKYIVPAAKTIADLLLSYEFFTDAFQGELNIPESGNGVPDILNETRYELEWFFKMQDAATGGVYHKLTTKSFPGLDVMPEDDHGDLYFMPISATATGDYAASMAMAARVYQPFDASFAERCLASAKKAYAWLKNNPDVPGFKNPPDIHTGEYGDGNDKDERYWAAAELYRTTGDSVYHEDLKELLRNGGFARYELGWADMGGYGSIAYLHTDASQVDADVYAELKAGFIEEANRLLASSKQDGYGISLGFNDYKWGSNMNVLDNAMHLIIAHCLAPNEEYIDAAQDHLHYILGRNALDYSHITGFGSKKVMHPHHRPSVGDGVVDPVPGLVTGGPNKGLQDEAAKEHLQGQPPARCFIDHVDSYSTNEITIYWNSPAVFVLGYFERQR